MIRQQYYVMYDVSEAHQFDADYERLVGRLPVVPVIYSYSNILIEELSLTNEEAAILRLGTNKKIIPIPSNRSPEIVRWSMLNEHRKPDMS